jgi:hypothetical protein
MTLRNGGLNQILKSQTSRSHYGLKSPAVTITVFKYRNKIGKIVVKTIPYSVNVNVKNTFTSHIDKKNLLTFFLTSLSLYIFTIWKCIAYNRFCRDGIYFDKILVSEYKLFKRSNRIIQFTCNAVNTHLNHRRIFLVSIPCGVGVAIVHAKYLLQTPLTGYMLPV